MQYHIREVVCHKQVSRAETSNYMPQMLCDGIICPCPWYLLLAQHSWYGPLARYLKCGLLMHREYRAHFPRHRLQRKSLVTDPGMPHGTCVMHVLWCMSGSLARDGGRNVHGIPGACTTRNYTYLVRDPWNIRTLVVRVTALVVTGDFEGCLMTFPFKPIRNWTPTPLALITFSDVFSVRFGLVGGEINTIIFKWFKWYIYPYPAGEWVFWDFQVRILHSAEEDVFLSEYVFVTYTCTTYWIELCNYTHWLKWWIIHNLAHN